MPSVSTAKNDCATSEESSERRYVSALLHTAFLSLLPVPVGPSPNRSWTEPGLRSLPLLVLHCQLC